MTINSETRSHVFWYIVSKTTEQLTSSIYHYKAFQTHITNKLRILRAWNTRNFVIIETIHYSFSANMYIWRHQIMRTMHTWPDIFTCFSFWPWEKVQHVRSKIVTMFIKRFYNTYQIPWIFRNKFYQNTLSCNLIYIQWTNCEKYMYI